ncbi:MAG: hypothetical protein KC417_14610 [Myxococcales bacterium]|nr:hypothetical protein [Myxococcales bacterium]
MSEKSESTGFDVGPASHAGTNSGDVKFVNAMTAAGLLTEMSADELDHVLSIQSSSDAATRYLDVLEHYYAANGDANVGLRRRMTDRFFMHRAEDPASAAQLLVRLSLLAPELGGVRLEYPSDETVPNARYALATAEHTALVLEDADEVNAHAPAGTVSVRGLVRAINSLLDHAHQRHRFVPLMRDDGREAFVATTITGALNLCQAEYLEEVDVEALIDFASW